MVFTLKELVDAAMCIKGPFRAKGAFCSQGAWGYKLLDYFGAVHLHN